MVRGIHSLSAWLWQSGALGSKRGHESQRTSYRARKPIDLERGLDLMSEHNEFSGFPSDFTGVVRLFPIPNRVFFPYVLQALRIFEPRYCAMLADALHDDQMLALSFEQPGWEAKSSTGIAGVACLGRVVSHARADRGEHNVLVLGMSRAIVRRELLSDRPYRTAEVTLLGDVYPTSGNSGRIDLQHHLLSCFAPFVPDSSVAREQFEEMSASQVPLGMLTDVLSFMVDVDLTTKQALLTERNVDVRASMLVECLEDMLRSSDSSYYDRPFPPIFSRN